MAVLLAPHFFSFNFVGCGEAESTYYVGVFYPFLMIDEDECGAVGGMRIGRGN
jgi:hypothetical protein